jgi:hypothetical protein
MTIRVPFLAAVLAAALTACGGGGGSPAVGPPQAAPANPSIAPTQTPTPAATATAAPTGTPAPLTANSTIVAAADGVVNGKTNMFAQMLGDAADGGQGAAIDGVTCQGTSEPVKNFYHVNAFLGLYVNGTMIALPAGIGEVQPIGPTQAGGTIYDTASQCMYWITKHDNSGVIHFENWNQPQPPSPIPAEYTLQNFFDIWGNGPGNANWPFANDGALTVYAGTPTSTLSNGNDIVGQYSYAASAGAIPITRHVAIWLVIGNLPAAGLPQVEFGMAQ